jgi:hypothetical protein
MIPILDFADLSEDEAPEATISNSAASKRDFMLKTHSHEARSYEREEARLG